MTTRFMRGTPYADLEIEMQKVPGFRSRRSGMIVSRLGYKTHRIVTAAYVNMQIKRKMPVKYQMGVSAFVNGL